MQFIILHGTFGSKDGNWFPWLEKKLTAINQDVLRPQLPVDDYDEVEKLLKETGVYKFPKQTKKSWLESFEEQVLHNVKKTPIIYNCTLFSTCICIISSD